MMNLQKTGIDRSIQTDDVISELCNKYYSLKNKEIISGLSFKERTSTAYDIINGCKDHEMYFYRRTLNEISTGIDSESRQKYRMINLASNDYLGLTKHPDIINAGIETSKKSGVGSGSVPMLAGTTALHKQLESDLSKFTGYPASITYNSCYAANYGLLTSLLTQSDVAILDTSVHASIIDGCCNTNKIYFKHNDPLSLKIALKKASEYSNKLVITDGVFSMDGDIACLDEIISIAKSENAWVMVDESHAIGVIGENGKGTHSHFSLREKADILTCSMGKALGGIGGFVAGSDELIHFLELTSRSYIFSTSLPQNVVAQLSAAINLIENDFSLHKKLWSNVHFLKNKIRQMGFEPDQSSSAIIPLIIRDEVKLLNFCKYLHNEGVFVNPVLYPVVPKKRARIRISVTSALNELDLEHALSVIEYAAKKLDII